MISLLFDMYTHIYTKGVANMKWNKDLTIALLVLIVLALLSRGHIDPALLYTTP